MSTMPTASILLLQKTLLKEVVSLLAEMKFENSDGETVTGVTGYEQRLPQITEDDEDSSQFFPYAVVRATGWNTKDDTDPWHVTIDVLFGIVDTSKDSHGHELLMNMIQKVADRFIHEPLLDHSYRAEQNIDAELQDEDTYPYYIGGIEFVFTAPKIERKIEFDENKYT